MPDSAKMHQIQFRLGLCPRPRCGTYSAPPNPLADGEGSDCPLPRTLPIPPALGPSGLNRASSPDPTALAPKPKSETPPMINV